MEKFTVHEGIVAPLDRANVDTDAIIPTRFLRSIKRTGFGENLFDEWRFLDHAEPGTAAATRSVNPAFVLNLPRYRAASILLCQKNFGCGSSREHAPWALRQYGFQVLIAPSFGDIFFGNCYKNGLLPVVLAQQEIDALFAQTQATEGFRLRVDLAEQSVLAPDGASHRFEIAAMRKFCLLNGLDDVGLTLQHESEISAFETRAKAFAPGRGHGLSQAPRFLGTEPGP